VALARTSENAAARAAATAFVQVFQGTPLLLQLFLVFFGAPVIGIDVNPWVAAGVRLILNTSAFSARSGAAASRPMPARPVGGGRSAGPSLRGADA
jgi:His/Glu/Gln/Arg/opine family amino acid ABC transporter permease subunit